MTTKRTFDQKSKLKPYILAFIGLLLLALIIYGVFLLQRSGKRLIPISVMAIIAGVLFEGKRLSDKWSTVLTAAGIAFVGSFFAFMPGKREHDYDLDFHVQEWPYWFIFIFAVFSIIFHGDKVMARLTEGITLLQSIAVVYWIIDYGFLEIESLFLKSLFAIGLLFSLYSVFHAFTYVVLSRSSRLKLSIWSTIIMVLFAIDNIIRVYQNEQIENTEDLTHGLYIGLQYFLLGASSIYFLQNLFLLIGFFPGKGTFFNAKYFRELEELKKDHIKRYSDRQVSIPHSFFCVLFTGVIFFLNYHYQIVPRHIAIWAVFVIFPFVLTLFENLTGKKNAY